MSNNVALSGLAQAITEALDEYSDEIAKKIDKAVDITTKEAVNELKKTSPRRSSDKPRKYTSSGKSYPAGSYAKSWEAVIDSKKKGNKSKTVRNKTHYRLTHLLERGHKGRNGGQVKAFPHIDSVDEKAIKDFEKRVEEAVNDS